MDHTYKPDFVYKHDNPYHTVWEFQDFVLRDSQARAFRGNGTRFFKREAPSLLRNRYRVRRFHDGVLSQSSQCKLCGLDYRFKRSYQVAKNFLALI